MKIDDGIRQKCMDATKWNDYTVSDQNKDLHGEVFTPTSMVIDILELEDDSFWVEGNTILDPTCGNGQFLVTIAVILKELGHKNVLNGLYGVDINADNVSECKQKLLAVAGNTDANNAIVDANILVKDAATYDYSFGKSPTESLFDWS